MTTDEQFTGVLLFPHPGSPKTRQFGIVACTVQPSGDGSVTIVFRVSDTGIVFSQDESSIRIDIPEALARQAVPIVSDALDRLAALRGGAKPSAI